MSALLPSPPATSFEHQDRRPACALVVPAHAGERDYTKTCKALPAGMPDRLELHVMRSAQGVERTTSVVYGERAYLVHYAFEPIG